MLWIAPSEKDSANSALKMRFFGVAALQTIAPKA